MLRRCPLLRRLERISAAALLTAAASTGPAPEEDRSGGSNPSGRDGASFGLALCREILEAHGGSLRLSPRDGGGLFAACRLPLAG
jgi:hypothetical protein